jgi:hypothetical protein
MPIRSALRLALMLACLNIHAADTATETLQQRFESRYQTYLSPGSQSVLPFEKLELEAWKALQASDDLKPVFSQPEVFYVGKTYIFTMYQAKNGQYYLHAKGGFWGMEELVWGPIPQEMLQ